MKDVLRIPLTSYIQSVEKEITDLEEKMTQTTDKEILELLHKNVAIYQNMKKRTYSFLN